VTVAERVVKVVSRAGISSEPWDGVRAAPVSLHDSAAARGHLARLLVDAWSVERGPRGPGAVDRADRGHGVLVHLAETGLK
jgi:hypothetical protein